MQLFYSPVDVRGGNSSSNVDKASKNVKDSRFTEVKAAKSNDPRFKKASTRKSGGTGGTGSGGSPKIKQKMSQAANNAKKSVFSQENG